MPTIDINGCKYYYEIHGQGPETILFSHGLLWSGRLFHKQVDYFRDRYRCVVYDHRGQGRSGKPAAGHDMDQLYQDAISLIQALDLGKVHIAGLSMGGFIAMRLAARNPELVHSAILMETSAQEEPFKKKYRMLTTVVKMFGVASVKNKVMPIMFGQKFLNDPARKEERLFWEEQLLANDKGIVKAVKGVIDRNGVEEEIKKITVPTLIMVGTQDVATIPEKAEFIHERIPGSRLVYIEGAGHSSSVEEPEQVNKAIEEFLAPLA